MSLTAEDIQTKQFHVRFRGFDIEEVDTFLERIAENFVLLNAEKKELKEKVEKLEMEINEFYSQEKTFQHAIISAQRISDEMQEKSRQEANARRVRVQEEIDRLRQQSTEEIDRLRKQSTDEKESLAREIAVLQENKSKVKEELRTYLQSYLTWLDRDVSLAENTPLSLLQSDIMDDGQPAVAEAAEVEVDGMYEKINFPDDPHPAEMEGMASALQENDSGEPDEEEDGERLTIPDLEGDMLFSLEDPLDEEEEKEPGPERVRDEDFFHDIKLK
ncbi:MAG: DivIVA domain-containing protein [Proteobacteria bacterium]|nr:DivIVA domain-containing protein [Pseudomonadota bacterium]MBU4298192.1 DivIVA domain-containing protein [Pseudomonadota bacterium]MCG2748109.1 DivIVA domain-containing protein [Desulfobulbaceae bacterium]